MMVIAIGQIVRGRISTDTIGGPIMLGYVANTAAKKGWEVFIGIMALISKDLTRWVALANLVAWPVAYLVMNAWLQNFAYRVGLSWLFFAAAGTITLAIAWLSMSFQAYKAANTDPVKALKYE